MRRNILSSWATACVAALLASCAAHTPRPVDGVVFNAESGRFSVHAAGVTRGELLDQLAKVAQIEVRPQPPRDERLTVAADDLDLDELLTRLMPADMRYIARRGQRELASKVPTDNVRKEGAAAAVIPGLALKGKSDEKVVEPMRTGTLKPAADIQLSDIPKREAGPMIKAEATALMVSEKNEPKKALPTRTPRATLRVTLLFEQGKAPKVLAAQTIEGGSPVEHFVRGPFLFLVVGTDGQILQYGSFEDPLEQHSYLPEGPHSTSRAQSGIAGISIDNTKLQAASLQIIDAREATLPRELNEEVVRGFMQRYKPMMTIPSTQLLRASQQEAAQ